MQIMNVQKILFDDCWKLWCLTSFSLMCDVRRFGKK